MKKSIFLLVAALLMGATMASAQKFGRVDYPGVIQAMPEMATVQTDLEKVQTEYEEHLETLQVELNNKTNDFQNTSETSSASVRELKQREILELQSRIQEYYQIAQQGLERTQSELMEPIRVKADAAIAKIAKADGMIVVFQNESMIYMDEAAVTDITARVKTELGIK